MASDARSGIVFIAWIDNEDESGYYSGYWDGAPDAGFLEQMPETPSIDVAVAWGRVRADRVVVRPSWDPAQYYSAGEQSKAGEPRLDLPGDVQT